MREKSKKTRKRKGEVLRTSCGFSQLPKQAWGLQGLGGVVGNIISGLVMPMHICRGNISQLSLYLYCTSISIL